MFMHSCWGIFYFVLTSFGLNLVVLEFLFENALENKMKKKKKKKGRAICSRPVDQNGRGRKPPGLLSFPPPRAAQLTTAAQTAGQGPPARLPFSLSSLTDIPDPHGSASIFLAPHRARRELQSDPYPRTPGFPCQSAKLSAL